MSYRTIAVHVNASRHANERVMLAARLAVGSDAHLVGVAATGVPEIFYMGSLSGEDAAGMKPYLERMRTAAAETLLSFATLAEHAGVMSFEKRMIDDEAGMALCLQARYSDLLVVGQSDPDEPHRIERTDVPEYVVLNAGRPVLLVPCAGKFHVLGQRALIAWDGSLAAARAITGAIPLLRKAALVQITVFNPESGAVAHGDDPGSDIALYLARHGVRVEVAQQHTGSDIDIGNALLSHVADFGADLLVMGAYGHSRFREILLGGVTRTVLDAMTVPVLMAH